MCGEGNGLWGEEAPLDEGGRSSRRCREMRFGVMQQQRPPPQGNEHVIIQWGIGAPPQEVLFQAGLCGLVKRNEPAFAEL